ncbi:MAG: hypothetical protein M1840_008713 [Geoglossum simile]|nr:MAG: hypothetical protein M1840_008713 [Geoglossum simile]
MAKALVVLGAVAASSQLAERCLVIANLIAGFILEGLQCSRIDSQTNSGQLEEELRKISVSAEDGKAKQIWTVLVGLTKEKILALLERLDQEKSILALCIETIDSALLHNIYLEFVKVRTTIDDVSKELPAIRDTARKVTTVFKALPYITSGASMLSSLDIKIATIHDELLPAVRALQLNQKASIPFAKEAIVEGSFMVPFARNDSFIGQHSLMEELSAKIEKGKKHSRVALVGLGGIGQVFPSHALLVQDKSANLINSKSQIALEYAYRRHEKSEKISIYWIHASHALRFEQDYVRIGLDLKLPGINDSGQDTKQLFKNWLSNKESGTWLMIVDNADDTNLFFGARDTRDLPSSKRLSEFLPQSPNRSIVVTTRNKKAGIKFASANGVIKNFSRLEDISNQDDGTKHLGLLEYLPLAVSQAASYIAENSISISEYLQMYNESEASGTELLSEDFEDLARDPETRNPVIVTWLISFDQIKQSNVLAADILSFMACVDRQGVPKALLPPAESPVKLSNALGLLKAYSLITANRSDMVFDMHRLVHLASRNWLRLNGAFEAAIDIFRARLAYKVSRYLHNGGSYNAAEPLAEQAARWVKKLLGPEHPVTLVNMDNLAEVLDRRGKYGEADEMHRQALESRGKALGPEHLDTLMSVEGLAGVLRNQGKYKEAEEMNRRTLESREKVLGSEHLYTVTSMSNMASVLQSLGKYRGAEEMLRRVLELREKVLGSEHPDTLMGMNNLAVVLQNQSKYGEAEEMHRRALKLMGEKNGQITNVVDTASSSPS